MSSIASHLRARASRKVSLIAEAEEAEARVLKFGEAAGILPSMIGKAGCAERIDSWTEIKFTILVCEY